MGGCMLLRVQGAQLAQAVGWLHTQSKSRPAVNRHRGQPVCMCVCSTACLVLLVGNAPAQLRVHFVAHLLLLLLQSHPRGPELERVLHLLSA